ncbi:FtsX-like permease family protein [Actinomyces capricornis]|uniref:ABC-type transport system permease n=1 Tax=Actinomyces capricornis TaxID=2755559 RepID=A0ABN6K5D3_9ACTO|nr:FtsX-like permease family protein [Actinomyces capricornis]BDA64730.1 ABC-type transport system permease [Actinomyces capricornis]
MPALLDLRRTAAAVVAVALAAALMAFAFIVSDSFATMLTSNARASVGGADAVVIAGRNRALSDQEVQDLSTLPEVQEVRPYREEHIYIDRPGHANDEHAFVLDIPPLTGETRLTSGRLPQADGEIAISASLAQHQDLEVGSTVPLSPDAEGGSHSSATVVGIIRPGAEVSRKDPREAFIFASPREQTALGLPDQYAVLYLTAAGGTSGSQLIDAASAAMAPTQPEAIVQSAQESIEQRTTDGNKVDSAALILLKVLGPVCAVVSAIVIATTFTTLVAKQTRTIGLLRCVGASRRQVRLAVLRAGLITGLAGSVLGSALGALMAVILIRAHVIDALGPRYLTVSWSPFALTILLSVLITLAAVLRPAHQGTRVSPLIALTGQVAAAAALGRRRAAAGLAGLVLAGLGVAVILAGISLRSPEVTALGAVVMVLGILSALPLLVVGAARIVERLGGGARRPVLQLACRNLARNPGRAAATTASLLVSVAVAATMATGLSSLNASMEGYVAAGSPIDIRVQEIAPDRDTAALTRQIENVDGVESTILVPTPELHLDAQDRSEEITVSAIDDGAIAPIVRSRHGLEGLDDNTLVVGGIFHLAEGSEVTLSGPAGTRRLRVHVEEGGYGPVITEATAEALTGGEPVTTSLWARTTGDGSNGAVAGAVRQELHGSGLLVSSTDQGRRFFTEQVKRTGLIISAILALSLLITLSGLSNTAEVSVVERTREVGVLRATGAERATIRRLFLTESVLMALLGGVIGTAVGIGVGAAGLAALIGTENGASAQVAVPWLILAGVVLVSGAVGAVACLRPAGRAAAVAPVAALATD